VLVDGILYSEHCQDFSDNAFISNQNILFQDHTVTPSILGNVETRDWKRFRYVKWGQGWIDHSCVAQMLLSRHVSIRRY